MPSNDKSATQELVRLRTNRADLEAYLRELYVERRLTDQEIAGAWGIHRMTVVTWRREWGIDRSQRRVAPDGASA